jgi:hypothetical protein
VTATWFLVFHYVKKIDFQGAAPNTSEPKLDQTGKKQANHECEWKDGERLIRMVAATSAFDNTFSWKEPQEFKEERMRTDRRRFRQTLTFSLNPQSFHVSVKAEDNGFQETSEFC